MTLDPVRQVVATVATVTPKTRWLFVEVTTAAGLRGVGEGTLTGREDAVIAAISRFAATLPEGGNAAPSALPATSLLTLPEAAAFSALDQALWDIAARRDGRSMAEALGRPRRGTVPLYANINRRTLGRAPAGVAARARGARTPGPAGVTIAPFDEATPVARQAGDLATAIEPGLARIRAVREAVGPTHRLMVDCHWRLDEAAAERVVDAAAEVGLHWVECPLPENGETLASLRRLRRRANRHGILLAGCEECIHVDGFQPFIQAGAYDVMMPDAKYVGGLEEMLRLAGVMRQAGIQFSPHNPSGPVCHAASLHVCAVVPNLHSLESQFDETPLFDRLSGQPLQSVVRGEATVPAGPGLGMALQPIEPERLRRESWTM
jgi:galactonate dehydratase